LIANHDQVKSLNAKDAKDAKENHINEQTLSFIPKLVGVFVATVVSGPWILQMLIDIVIPAQAGIHFDFKSKWTWPAPG
jgi:hypothetical protein